jgi:hypothetical protein
VRSTDIVDGEIGAADIADESVNGAKITDGSVATGDLANNAVTSAKIADATVAVGDLGTDSVISTKVLNDTLTGDDITESTLGAVPLATNLANVTVKRVEFTVANGADNGAIAVCPAGQQAISGGVRNDNLDTDGYVEVSRPSLGTGEGPTDGESFDGWRAFVFNQTDAQSGQTFGGNTLQATVWAVCAG